MGAPKMPKKNQNGNIMGAHQIKRAQGNFFCPRIKGAPFIRYFRVYEQSEIAFIRQTNF